MPVQKEKELSQYFFLTSRTFFLTLKQIGRSWCQACAKKPAFDTSQTYNISAPKTNLLESSYPLFLASQLQVRCRSRYFRTSLEVKQNVIWSAFQLLLCKTWTYWLVTLSLCARNSDCRVSQIISIFRLCFVGYLHLPCADFQVTSGFQPAAAHGTVDKLCNGFCWVVEVAGSGLPMSTVVPAFYINQAKPAGLKLMLIYSMWNAW